jgi:hypothetical protein
VQCATSTSASQHQPRHDVQQNGEGLPGANPSPRR